MLPVDWANAALADIQRIRNDIADFNPYAAHDMALRILEAGDGLATFPFRGRAVPNARVREITVSYPDIIRYQSRARACGHLARAAWGALALTLLWRSCPVRLKAGSRHSDCLPNLPQLRRDRLYQAILAEHRNCTPLTANLLPKMKPPHGKGARQQGPSRNRPRGPLALSWWPQVSSPWR